MDLREWTAAHEVRVQHITVTIWKRRGATGLAAYSLTLTRSFWSHRANGYRSTNKLFAEDAPLAAQAFRTAYEWILVEEDPSTGHE
jgi:hypothetical protein